MSIFNYLDVIGSSSSSSSRCPISSSSAPASHTFSTNRSFLFSWFFFLFYFLCFFLGRNCRLKFFSWGVFIASKWWRYCKFPCSWIQRQIFVLAKWKQPSRPRSHQRWSWLCWYSFHETICYWDRTIFCWLRSINFPLDGSIRSQKCFTLIVIHFCFFTIFRSLQTPRM